jgi:predicted AAA+ superfamily ATPase
LQEREFDLALRNYLRDGGFPEFLQLQEPTAISRYFWDNLAERTLYYDIPEIFRVEDRELLQKLFVYCVCHSGSIVNLVDLANSFSATRQTISNYLNFLNAGLLVQSVSKYSKTAAGRLRAFKKVYACDPGMVVHIQRLDENQVDEKGLWGALGEIAVFSQLQHYCPEAHLYYYRDRDRETDFVIDLFGRLVPIEVKYRDKIAIPNGLAFFKRRFQTEVEIVITRNQFDRKGSFLFIPFRLFLS